MKRVAVCLWMLLVLAWGCGGSGGSSAPSVATFSSGGNLPEAIGIDRSDDVWISVN